MIRVLLVDDEALVRVGLKSLVPWNELGYEVVGEAAGGEAALMLLDTLRPQLMITDIVMPRLSGTELIRTAKKKYPELIVIALSGYNEYDLVREAMKNGATDYLLKLNLSSESLSELLTELRQEHDLPDEPADGNGGKDSKLALRHQIKQAIGFEGGSPGREIILPANVQGSLMTLGFINSNLYTGMERYSQQDAKHLEMTIVDILEEILASFYPGCALEWGGGAFVLLLFAESFEQGQLDLMGRAMLQMLKTYVNIDSAVAFSAPFCSPDGIEPGFRQARQAIRRIFRSGYHTVHFSDDADPQPSMTERDPLLVESLSRALILQDAELVQTAFRKLEECIPSFAQRRDACDWVNQIVCMCDLALGEGFAAFKQGSSLALEQIYLFRTADELAGWFRQYAELVTGYQGAESRKQTHPLIRKAKRYVQEHISEQIALNDVAAFLGISAGYFSTLFTKSAGINFKEYVNQAKIERAKEILREGGHRIYETAYLLGFDNVCYFNKLFKKQTGCTPGQYQSYAEKET